MNLDQCIYLMAALKDWPGPRYNDPAKVVYPKEKRATIISRCLEEGSLCVLSPRHGGATILFVRNEDNRMGHLSLEPPDNCVIKRRGDVVSITKHCEVTSELRYSVEHKVQRTRKFSVTLWFAVLLCMPNWDDPDYSEFLRKMFGSVV